MTSQARVVHQGERLPAEPVLFLDHAGPCQQSNYARTLGPLDGNGS
jgi:hypothetical protein